MLRLATSRTCCWPFLLIEPKTMENMDEMMEQNASSFACSADSPNHPYSCPHTAESSELVAKSATATTICGMSSSQ